MQLTPAQIQTAVHWWANVFVNPRMDSGDTSPNGGVVSAMAMLAVQPIMPEQQSAFREILSDKLTGTELLLGSLIVDYHPCPTLAEAMDWAGIPQRKAPLKTRMWFRNGGVQVRYGYGSELKELPLLTSWAPISPTNAVVDADHGFK